MKKKQRRASDTQARESSLITPEEPGDAGLPVPVKDELVASKA